MYTRRKPRIVWQRGVRRAAYQIAGVFTAIVSQVFFNGFATHYTSEAA